jgi:hypothetical protein
MLNFLAELKRRNTALYWFGWINWVALVVALIMYGVDPTEIKGINAWIKPMKFAISVAVYAWTFAWLLEYISATGKRNFISWGIIACMTVENVLIYFQAFRGTTSHYNVQTAFDGIIFSTMGMFITINTLLVLYTIILFFSKNVALDPALLWAWRAGLVLFFLAGISGGLMVGRLAHSVGVADGGPGLPLLNWSTVAGDIRVAHFITLHGLQAIPIAAYFFISFARGNAKLFVTLFAIAYAGICIWLHWQAINGIPFISIK